jgi:flagellar basal-body rod modification protein FlgD
MMNVSNVDSSSMSSATSSTSSNKTLGKDDFLKMLLAQLKNQDPLNPVNGTDFASQLAQFTSLEQLTNMSTQLANMSLAQSAGTNAQSIDLIGKVVTASPGNNVLVNGASTSLSYSLDTAANQVTINIYDGNGSLVNTLNYTNQVQGVNTVTWNTANVTKGNYTFSVAASDAAGNNISATTNPIIGTVTGVQFKNGTIYLMVNGQQIPFSSILSVNKPQA